jgi:hypothetical protein
MQVTVGPPFPGRTEGPHTLGSPPQPQHWVTSGQSPQSMVLEQLSDMSPQFFP